MGEVSRNTYWNFASGCIDQMDGLAKESAEEMAGYSLHMADSGTRQL